MNFNILMKLRNAVCSNGFFIITIAIFIIVLGFVSVIREGKDLKVGLFGVEQVLVKKSPYDNPIDPNRPLFRYAPGFTILQYPFLLKAKMTAPYEFKNITPSVISWYLINILSLFITAFILLKIIPASSKDSSFSNLKLAILMVIPLIGYELANGQNKLIALVFMAAAIILFEKNRLFLSAIFYSLALTVYIPLIFFVCYFFLRKKPKFILNLLAAVIVVFIILPSMVFGFEFNVFLLKAWFWHTIKPFFLTNSYVSYIDLRVSSQSLPSAIGRIFVSGHTENFNYHIPGTLIHMIIRGLSLLIVFFSCLAVWKEKDNSRGLGYAIFLILALILPQYPIYYNWSWMFILYFAVFNYVGFKEVTVKQKKTLLGLVFVSYVSFISICFHQINQLSFVCWATLALWIGLIYSLKPVNAR